MRLSRCRGRSCLPPADWRWKRPKRPAPLIVGAFRTSHCSDWHRQGYIPRRPGGSFAQDFNCIRYSRSRDHSVWSSAPNRPHWGGSFAQDFGTSQGAKVRVPIIFFLFHATRRTVTDTSYNRFQLLPKSTFLLARSCKCDERRVQKLFPSG